MQHEISAELWLPMLQLQKTHAIDWHVKMFDNVYGCQVTTPANSGNLQCFRTPAHTRFATQQKIRVSVSGNIILA